MPEVTLDNAIYSWWVHPVAVNDGDVTWVGSIAKAGTNRVHRITWDGPVVDAVKLGGQDTPDDHNGAAIAISPAQSNLLAFYARHNSDTWVRWRTVHRQTFAVSTERHLDFGGPVTYAQVLQPPDTDILHVLCRAGTTSLWKYRTSPDWGASWGPVKTLVNGAGHGQQYVVARPDPQNPALVHMAHYGHPVNSDWRKVGYARIDLTNGTISTAAGVLLGDLDEPAGPGLLPEDLESAISPSAGFKVRLLDIGAVAGRPAISYAVWSGETGAATYKVKVLSTAGAWTTADWEVPSGPPFGYLPAIHYVGGVAIARDGRLYSARKQGSNWLVERWQWNGTGYDLHSEIDRSTTRLVRPYAVHGLGEGEMVYQRLGRYDSFTEYDADLIVRSG